MSDAILWNLCFICQQITADSLVCPAENIHRGETVGSGYDTLADNLKCFHEQGERLDVLKNFDLSELADVFRKNSAKWHKKCALKYSKMKLERLMKRRSTTASECSSVDYGVPADKKVCLRKDFQTSSPQQCFFCEKDLPRYINTLHAASTLEIDSRVRQIATRHQQTKILAKLAKGDMIATEAVYHQNCLRAFYNIDRPRVEIDSGETSSRIVRGIALEEVISHMREQQMNDTKAVFKLSELVKTYCTKLTQFGVNVETRFNSTRFKERLLEACPDMSCHTSGRETIIASEQSVAQVLRDIQEENSDVQGCNLAKTARLVRKEILDLNTNKFPGKFTDDWKETSTPKTLRALLSLILMGTDTTHSETSPEIVQNLAELIVYNTSGSRCQTNRTVRHNKSRETPLPIYVALLVHSQTRQRNLIDKFFHNGLSVSYNRLLDITNDVNDEVCSQFAFDGAVCPLNLKRGIFVTSAIDNLDHNPRSNTAKSSFHGTGVSLFQTHSPTDVPEERIRCASVTKDAKLCKSYTQVLPCPMKINEPQVPEIIWNVPSLDDLRQSDHISFEWPENVLNDINEKSNIENKNEIHSTWSAYNANKIISDSETPKTATAMLPLFHEDSKSIAMIRHAMIAIQKSTEFLNGNQHPVIAFDQPLYALAKKIQWKWPNDLEGKCVIMLGGLHLEMAMLASLGDWLKGSGWVETLERAKVASHGIAESFLTGSNVKSVQYAHEVTACALYILFMDAYNTNSAVESIDHFRVLPDRCTQFKFWQKTLELELLVLDFVKSLRVGDFELYKQTLLQIAPIFFAFDHTNYARWLPVHLRDMLTLEEKHPDVYKKFKEGHFVVKKTGKKFSGISIGQAHEQNNKTVKGDGGIIGLTENESAMNRWLTVGPEIVQIIKGYDEERHSPVQPLNDSHHESLHSFQKRFLDDVKSMVDTIRDDGNPFMEGSNDLVALQTKNIISCSKDVDLIPNIFYKGVSQFHTFLCDRLLGKGESSIFDTIHKNNFSIFSVTKPSNIKTNPKLAMLKHDTSLFSRLYIASQHREGNVREFFEHENHCFPPSHKTTCFVREIKLTF